MACLFFVNLLQFKTYFASSETVMSCNCSSNNTEILKLIQDLKQDLSQVKNDCFQIRQEFHGITEESQEFGLMENVTIRQVMERMAFDIETLKARTEPTPGRDHERRPENPDNVTEPVTTYDYDNSTSAEHRTPTPDFQNQEEYDKWLKITMNTRISETSIADGASIEGRSISSISSSVSPEYETSLTLEIVNYHWEPLVELETLVPYGLPYNSIPARIDPKGREVLVYRGDYPKPYNVPCGALSFRIGSENQRISIYFCPGSTNLRRFGMALTASDTTFQDLGWATGSSSNWPPEVIPKDDLPTDYVCRQNIDTTSTFSIENNLTYVLATLITGKRSIWKIELFPKAKIRDLVPAHSAFLDIFSSTESYIGMTALDFMDTIPGTRGILVELANGLGLSLQDARSYFSNTTSRSNLVPKFIPPNKKKIIYWATTNGNLTSVVTYTIGMSDIRLAVATNSNPRGGNKFGLKFVSSNTIADSTTFSEVMIPTGWERNSHKVGPTGGGAMIVIQMRNLRATASMSGEPKSLLKVVLEKYF